MPRTVTPLQQGWTTAYDPRVVSNPNNYFVNPLPAQEVSGHSALATALGEFYEPLGAFLSLKGQERSAED